MTLSAKLRHCAVAATVLGVIFAAGADTIHVPGDQPTIQIGINVAQPGDEVVVAPGVYHEVINFNGKAITVRSSDGRDVTTIDGTGLKDSVVKCISGEGPDTVLEGFMITGGDAVRGGGIQCSGASPTLTALLIRGNTALRIDGRSNQQVGGGLFCLASDPLVTECIFDENRAAGGGGFVTAAARGGGSHPTFVNCFFTLNNSNNGGAIAISRESGVTIINSLFTGNTSEVEGGAISVADDGSVTIVNSTFVGNSSAGGDPGGAVRTRAPDATATILNSVFWNNVPNQVSLGNRSTVSYSDIQGAWPGAGNIDADPLFVDPENGDFRLLRGSPAIDAADNTAVPPDVTVDLDGNPRFIDDPSAADTGNGTAPIVDMGAYEFQAFSLGDLNCDESVNAFDIEPFLVALFETSRYVIEYPDCDPFLADINQDGFIDAFDIEPFLEVLFP